MNSTNILSVKDLCVRFGGIQAVSDVSFDVSHGERLGIIGPNGAGKTTLLNAVSRLVPATGSLMYSRGDGTVDLLRSPAHRLRRMGVARTFQSPQLLDEITIGGNVELGAYGTDARSSTATQQEETRHVNSLCRLEGWTDVLAHDAPHGVRKLTEISRALSFHPRLVLLDEPGAGLSQAEKQAVVEAIRDAAADSSVLIIDHDIDMITEISDRIIVLDFGKLVAAGKPDVVLRDPDVLERYFGVVPA